MWFSKKKALAATEECINEMMKEVEESDELVKGFNEKLDKILEQQNLMAQNLDDLKFCLGVNGQMLNEMWIRMLQN